MTGTTKPRVTVIIAASNRANSLRYAIESVLWQTFSNFELWVIGDGCDTEEMLIEYSKDARIHFYNPRMISNSRSNAINEGIRRARGEYIAYLTDGDIWLSNHLEKMVDYLDVSDSDACISLLQRVYSFTKSKPEIPILPTLPTCPQISTLIHKKTIIYKTGYWRQDLEGDDSATMDFIRRVQFLNLRVEVVQLVTVLKFHSLEKSFGENELASWYVHRMRNEPDFANTELSRLLFHAYEELQQLPASSRVGMALIEPLYSLMLRMRIDPKRLLFWKGGRRKGENATAKLGFNGTAGSNPAIVKLSTHSVRLAAKHPMA